MSQDAYRIPRKVSEGCQHQLACKCEPAYWLRLPTSAELARWPITRQAEMSAAPEVSYAAIRDSGEQR